MQIAYCGFTSNLWDVWNSAVENKRGLDICIENLAMCQACLLGLINRIKPFLLLLEEERQEDLLILFNLNKARSSFEIRLYSHNNSCTRPKLQQASCERRSAKDKTPFGGWDAESIAPQTAERDLFEWASAGCSARKHLKKLCVGDSRSLLKSGWRCMRQTRWSDTFCGAQTCDVAALLLDLLESLLMSSLRKQEAEKANKEDNMTLGVHRQRAVQNLLGWKSILISSFGYFLRE